MLEFHVNSSDMLTALSWVLVAPFLVALAYLILELFVGLIPSKRFVEDRADCPSIVILIPAHNERPVIAETVKQLRSKVADARIVVVADNCSDTTAAAARNVGADVIERNDESRVGKGYALAYGRDYLAQSCPEVVVILDADCRVSEGTVEKLALMAASNQGPVQAKNLFRPDRSLSASLQISNFAMFVKNWFRMRGMSQLGGTSALLGTGMAFPWQQFVSLPLATGDAAEDIALTIELITRGHTIAFSGDAEVWSEAESSEDTAGQRKRWEHGFLGHALRQALPTLAKGIARRSPGLIVIGAHMLVPPLALLLILSGAVLLSASLMTLVGASILPAAALLTLLGITGVLLSAAWIMGGHKYLTFRAIASLPVYVIWKMPIYLSFITKRQRDWND